MDQEPQDAADRLRVSDREREQIVELLGNAAVEGRLTLDEYTERAGEAHSARTRGELARLVDDLPSGQARPAAVSPATGSTSERLVAIFSSDSRKGKWLVPERLEAQSVFGECNIELQDAQIQHPVTVIEATAIFGSVSIFVPEGVDVRLSGTAIFGEKESKLRTPPAPGAPVIEVRARVIFGSVVVRPPKKRWF